MQSDDNNDDVMTTTMASPSTSIDALVDGQGYPIARRIVHFVRSHALFQLYGGGATVSARNERHEVRHLMRLLLDDTPLFLERYGALLGGVQLDLIGANTEPDDDSVWWWLRHWRDRLGHAAPARAVDGGRHAVEVVDRVDIRHHLSVGQRRNRRSTYWARFVAPDVWRRRDVLRAVDAELWRAYGMHVPVLPVLGEERAYNGGGGMGDTQDMRDDDGDGDMRTSTTTTTTPLSEKILHRYDVDLAADEFASKVSIASPAVGAPSPSASFPLRSPDVTHDGVSTVASINAQTLANDSFEEEFDSTSEEVGEEGDNGGPCKDHNALLGTAIPPTPSGDAVESRGGEGGDGGGDGDVLGMRTHTEVEQARARQGTPHTVPRGLAHMRDGDGVNMWYPEGNDGAEGSQRSDAMAVEDDEALEDYLCCLRSKFLSGEWPDFDYATCDYDDRLDDAVQVALDAEERYFDDIPEVPTRQQERLNDAGNGAETQ